LPNHNLFGSPFFPLAKAYQRLSTKFTDTSIIISSIDTREHPLTLLHFLIHLQPPTSRHTTLPLSHLDLPSHDPRPSSPPFSVPSPLTITNFIVHTQYLSFFRSFFHCSKHSHTHTHKQYPLRHAQLIHLSLHIVDLLASVPKVNCSIMIWSKSVEPTRNGFS